MKKLQLRKYTEQQLRDAISTSKSIRETLKKLNVCAAGAGYKTFHKYVKLLNIDISHFTGQLWNKGRKFGPKRPLNDYLTNKQTIQSFKLKNRLLKENIFKHQCQNCNLDKWLGRAIPLELHHKDGNHLNNTISNLTLLCPNCHSLTENYRSKNKMAKVGLEPTRELLPSSS